MDKPKDNSVKGDLIRKGGTNPPPWKPKQEIKPPLQKAIEHIKEILTDEIQDPDYAQGLKDAIEILKQEAGHPCERCKELEIELDNAYEDLAYARNQD